jgi:hypothetical protein
MKIYELGNPPTREQINRIRLNSLLTVALCTVITLIIAPLLSTLGDAFITPALVIAGLPWGMVAIMTARGAFPSCIELGAFECERVAEWRDNSTAVQAYVTAVIAQGRQMVRFEMENICRRMREEEDADRRNKLYAPDRVNQSAKKTDDWDDF